VILCLDCLRMWPAGTRYCGCCRHSLGGRRCLKCDALSPAESTCCLQCGSGQLAHPARSLSLVWVPKLLAWTLVLVLVRVLFAHPGWLLGALGAVTGLVTGVGAGTIVTWLVQLAITTAMPFVFGWWFLERGRLPSRCLATYAALWRCVFKAIGATGRVLWPRIRQAIEGPTDRPGERRRLP
jgi:ribosomal protein L40E